MEQPLGKEFCVVVLKGIFSREVPEKVHYQFLRCRFYIFNEWLVLTLRVLFRHHLVNERGQVSGNSIRGVIQVQTSLKPFSLREFKLLLSREALTQNLVSETFKVKQLLDRLYHCHLLVKLDAC